MGEFDLIGRYFRRDSPSDPAVVLGPGDDCALLAPDPGHTLAVSSDMLLEHRHFLPDIDPAALGYKALAVNLSDLAAMGAAPLAFTLALALPAARAGDAAWLQAFSDGLLTLARNHRCPLVGGDTTAGPLALSITVLGQVPQGQALHRAGAQAGDDIWISGTLGDARLALGALRGEWPLPPPLMVIARARLERPTPRLALGQALRGVASSAIDVSDGLVGDLQHILQESGVGARIQVASLAQAAAVCAQPLAATHLKPQQLLAAVLAGGDDYELLFTAPPNRRPAVQQAAKTSQTPVLRIGCITAAPALQLIQADGGALDAQRFAGYDHFA